MTLDRARIVTEAVALLDEHGLDELSLYKLAARLGVRQPTLYWHLPSKAALLTEVADAILREQFPDPDPADPADPQTPWRDWLASIATRLRRALLAHPDGARILSAAQLSTRMNALSELMIHTLAAQNIPLRAARIIVLSVQRFTVGYVLEEQSAQPDQAALREVDLTAFAATHPNMTTAVTEYFQDGHTIDDLFTDCLTVVLDGATATIDRAT